jgi:hypothetical protein
VARGLSIALAALALGLAGRASAQAPAPAAPPPHPVVYDMEMLATGPLPPGILKKIEPLHTLQAVEDLLKEDVIPFAWSRQVVSAGAMPPEIAHQIEVLPPHDIFMMKQGQGWAIGAVLSKR